VLINGENFIDQQIIKYILVKIEFEADGINVF